MKQCGNQDEAMRRSLTRCFCCRSTVKGRNDPVVLWTSQIAFHSRNGDPRRAIRNFRQMQLEGILPDSVTWITVLKACARSGSIHIGQSLQAQIVGCGAIAQITVANALINAFGKCGSAEHAGCVFEAMQNRDVVSWNAVITAFAQNGHYARALQIFDDMLTHGNVVEPDSVTIIAALNACVEPSYLDAGKRLHHFSSTKGLLEVDVSLGNALINMYSKCGSLDDACEVFASIRDSRDVISWNGMISTLAQYEEYHRAFHVFKEMQLEGFAPDRITMVTTLNACETSGVLEDVQRYVVELGLDADVIIGNALMNAYGKCGNLKDARRTFDELHQRDVVSWNAMITAYTQHGEFTEALRLYEEMRRQKIVLNRVTMITTLSACTTPEALHHGKHIHDRIVEFGFDSDLIVGNALVNMYSKCGSVVDARSVFEKMEVRDIVTWNAMIGAYVQSGMNKEALQMFRWMQLEKGVDAGKITYATVLGACVALRDVTMVDSCIKESGYHDQVMVANALMVMYSKCHSVQDARRVFEAVQQPEVVLWNSMIETYVQHGRFSEAQEIFESMEEQNSSTWNIVIGACSHIGEHEEAFRLFRKMRLEGAETNRGTFLALLGSCSGSEVGVVHRRIQEAGYESDMALGGALVKSYGRCGMPAEAKKVFDAMPVHDVVSWTTMIAAYVQNGDTESGLETFELMQQAEVVPDSPTLVTVLGGLTEPEWIDEGRRVHARIVECGWETEVMVENALITMYGKCRDLDEAVEVFKAMDRPNLISWNSLISAYVNCGCYHGAFKTFQRMQLEGVEPNNVTFITILNSCMVDKEMRVLEACDVEARVDSDVAIGNALLSMYGKRGDLQDAKRLFKKMDKQRDVVTWNAMIAANVQNGRSKEAIHLLEGMQLQGVVPNNVTFINILNVCSTPRVLAQGKMIHEMISQTGLDTRDVAVGNAVINMYGKCWGLDEAVGMFRKMARKDLITWNGMMAAYSHLGKFEEAKNIFDEMEERDVVTWNSIIAVHSHHDQADEALGLFNRMLLEGMAPSSVTLVVILGACATKGSLVNGRRVHGLVRETQLESDVQVGNSLVHMYGRCGNYDAAWKVFDGMDGKDVVTWNGLIAAYAHNGHALDALRLFYVMQREGHRPTDLTFVSVLTACSHAGRIEDARGYFASLVHDYEVLPLPSHYGCMVDLLARSGRLEEAQEFIKRMPHDESVAPWMALLSGCRVQENVFLAKAAASYVMKSDPSSGAANVVLSGIYASSAAVN